jgi:protein-disulfide isomerase
MKLILSHFSSFFWGVVGSFTAISVVVLLRAYWLPPLLLGAFNSRPDILQAGIGSLERLGNNQKQDVVQRLPAREKLALTKPFGPNKPPHPKTALVVEFSDYKCSFCKLSQKELAGKFGAQNVQIIVRELPVLGSESELAAKYALAAALQGKYDPVRAGLMNLDGLTVKNINQVLLENGVDLNRAQIDANSDIVREEIQNNRNLSEKLNVQGTPAFVIGNSFIGGYKPNEIMKAVLANSK